MLTSGAMLCTACGGVIPHVGGLPGRTETGTNGAGHRRGPSGGSALPYFVYPYSFALAACPAASFAKAWVPLPSFFARK